VIIDARSLNPATLPSADAIIIGSGPVGIAMALRFEAHGVRSLVVEAGGRRYDRTIQNDTFAADEITPEIHHRGEEYRRRMLGGTSSVWGGRCIPFDSRDFEATSLRDGWPMSWDEMAAYIPDALEFLEAGLPEFSTAEAFPRDRDPALPGYYPDLVLDDIERFSRPTNVWRRYSVAVAKSAKILLIHDATCVSINTSDDGNWGDGVEILDSHGRKMRLSAPRTILAVGGIETPRLLLNSNAIRSCGIGNEVDLVGRHYMTHLGGRLGKLVLRCAPDQARLDYRVSHDGVYCRSLLKLSTLAARRLNLVAVVFRPAIQPVWDPRHGDSVLSAMFLAKSLIAPEYARALAAIAPEYAQTLATQAGTTRAVLWPGHAANVIRGMPRLVRFGLDWTRRRILASRKLPSVFVSSKDGVYPIIYDAEHLPYRESRIRLGTSRDRFGMRKICIEWRVPTANFDALASACFAFRQAIACARTAELRVDDDQVTHAILESFPVGGHHIGTTRMGTDPNNSVVNQYGEVWGTRRLFVAGSAIFPTSGFANPTLTAVALALRQADHIGRFAQRR
jgi:choline dehydrogenase-like flavoprotein